MHTISQNMYNTLSYSPNDSLQSASSALPAVASLTTAASAPVLEDPSAQWSFYEPKRAHSHSLIFRQRHKYRRPKPNTWFGTLLYEYDRNYSAVYSSTSLVKVLALDHISPLVQLQSPSLSFCCAPG